jgi:hypothetical protein
MNCRPGIAAVMASLIFAGAMSCSIRDGNGIAG